MLGEQTVRLFKNGLYDILPPATAIISYAIGVS